MPEVRPHERPLNSILFLTYKRADLIDERIREVERLYSSRSDVELIVFDNGSEGPQISLCLMAFTEITKLNNWQMQFCIHNIKENVGFSAGWNKALQFANGEYVFLISDDVQVFGDFIAPVVASLKVAPNAIIGEKYVNWRAGWNEFGSLPPIPYIMGHFLAMKKATWDVLGGFDEQFFPYDYEDLDLSYRAVKEGFPLIQLSLPVIHHAASTIGYNPDRYAHTVRMRAKFAEKWGLPNEPKVP